MKLLAIIPAKKNSRRLFIKNFKMFFGKPIIQWVMKEIDESDLFDKKIISTDLPEMPFLGDWILHHRPEHLCTDTATVNEVCLDVFEKYPGYDYMCTIYPCAYAVTWQDLCKAFIDMQKDMVGTKFSVNTINKEKYSDPDNGGFYFRLISDFINTKKLIPEPLLDIHKYDMSQVDINDMEDFAMAKLHALTLGDRFK